MTVVFPAGISNTSSQAGQRKALRELSDRTQILADAVNSMGGGGGAPTDAQYVVGAANGSLSAERVVTDTPTVAWDLATGGQAKAAIPDDAVTFAKMQDIATNKLLGRATAGSGNIEEIALTAAGRALLDDADASAQRTTLGLAALAIKASVGTGDIDNDAVTYAKIQDVSATDKLLGRSTAGAGNVEEIPCTAAGRAIIDDADAAAQRTTLGLGSAATSASTDFATAIHSHAEADITGLVADLAAKAALAGPAFTGVPTAPTAAPGIDTTQIATTAFAKAADDVVLGAAETYADGVGDLISGQVADTYVQIATYDVDQALLAPKASPIFTGVPLAPTPSYPGATNDQIVTAQYVGAAESSILSQAETIADALDVDVYNAARARANHTGTQLLATISDRGALAALNTVDSAHIDDAAVTIAKIQNINTDTVLGRATGGSGPIETLVMTAAGRALVDDADITAQRATLGLAALAIKATVATADIDNDAVTYAKIQNVSATDKVLGRSTAGAGDVEEIALTAAGRALIDDADNTAQRTTLGLGTAATHAHTDYATAVHSHAEADVTNLVTDLAAKAPLASPALTGTPTVPTAAAGTNTTQAASTAFVEARAARSLSKQSTVVALAASTTINLPLLDIAVLAGDVWTLDYMIPFTVSGGVAGLKPIFTLPASSTGTMIGHGTLASVTGYSTSYSATPGTAMAVGFGTASFTGFIHVRATITITTNGNIRIGVATGASAAGNLLAGASVLATRA